MWKPNLKNFREHLFYDTLQTALEMKTFEASQFWSEVVSSCPQSQLFSKQNNAIFLKGKSAWINRENMEQSGNPLGICKLWNLFYLPKYRIYT